MKTVKRITAIVLLILTAFIVGYLVYTGSRLTAASDYLNKKTVQAEVVYVQDKGF